MRNRYIVTYDISDEKRLRKIFNIMRGFGNPIQYSVFICELSEKEKAILESLLIEIIHAKEDRIMIINIGLLDSNPEKRIEFLGLVKNISEQRLIVI
ncbi:MAG: CRISPR-associated endonuclease Cas2 [Thermoplasmata archaeon]